MGIVVSGCVERTGERSANCPAPACWPVVALTSTLSPLRDAEYPYGARRTRVFLTSSGDVGGGDWIVERSFRLVYDELFLKLDKTLITKMVFEKYGIETREEFLALVSKFDSDDADEYMHDFIDFFFAALDAGDGPAYKLCQIMSERGAQFIAALSKQMEFDGNEIEVVLSGSINIKLNSPIYLNMLINRSQELSGRKLKFVKLTKPPVVGCINWIMQKHAYL